MLDDRFYVAHGPLTIADIIEGLDVSRLDPPFLDEEIVRPTQVEGALSGDVTFIQSKKTLAGLETCRATACFVTEDLAEHVGEKQIIPLVTSTPRAHFARASARLVSLKSWQDKGPEPQIARSAIVHPSAIVCDGAVIGERAVIGPNCVIGPGCVIGDDCVIEDNVSLKASVMGAACVIKPNAVIGSRGFGIEGDTSGVINIPHFGRVIIGDRVQIGAGSCVDRGQLGDTVLDNDVKLDNLVQIGHNVNIGEGSCLAAQTGISGSCKIGRGVMMGGAVGLADHLYIGDNVSIAARSGVMHDIPEGETWGGIPAQPIKRFMREVAYLRRTVQGKTSTKPSSKKT